MFTYCQLKTGIKEVGRVNGKSSNAIFVGSVAGQMISIELQQDSAVGNRLIIHICHSDLNTTNTQRIQKKTKNNNKRKALFTRGCSLKHWGQLQGVEVKSEMYWRGKCSLVFCRSCVTGKFPSVGSSHQWGIPISAEQTMCHKGRRNIYWRTLINTPKTTRWLNGHRQPVKLSSTFQLLHICAHPVSPLPVRMKLYRSSSFLCWVYPACVGCWVKCAPTSTLL